MPTTVVKSNGTSWQHASVDFDSQFRRKRLELRHGGVVRCDVFRRLDERDLPHLLRNTVRHIPAISALAHCDILEEEMLENDKIGE